MFGLFGSKEIENFAIELVGQFAKQFPADALKRGAHQPKAIAGAIDDLCNRAADFQRSKRLGVLGKARFGTAFKYQLKESGYNDEFVDELTRSLLIRMSGK